MKYQSNPMNTKRKRKRGTRNALVLLETIVAASLVMTMIVVTTPLVIRSARIWKQTRNYQFAGDELAAQMDRLIAMSSVARLEALDALTVSTEASTVLHEATLTGNILQDDDGKRIELSIDWQRAGDPKPVTLVAWIDPLPKQASIDSEPVELQRDDTGETK